jgi:hypothetical protein
VGVDTAMQERNVSSRGRKGPRWGQRLGCQRMEDSFDSVVGFDSIPSRYLIYTIDPY